MYSIYLHQQYTLQADGEALIGQCHQQRTCFGAVGVCHDAHACSLWYIVNEKVIIIPQLTPLCLR